MKKTDTTAILLFSRTAAEEAGVKSFVPQMGKKGNMAIANLLIRHTLKVSRATGLPVFSYFSEQQAAVPFGERLANAIEAVFEKGYERVIAIGNDSPQLTTQLLFKSGRALEQRSLVLGPAMDGGVYLIGIQKTAYRRQLFLDLPWQKNTLKVGWEEYAIQSGTSIQWLETLGDIDYAGDLNRLLKDLSNYHQLFRRFSQLLKSFCPGSSITFFFSFFNDYYPYTFLRAPPFRITCLKGIK